MPKIRAKKILIIDDERDFCDVVEKNLSRVGDYEVMAAYTGMENAELGTEAVYITDLIFHQAILDASGNDFMKSFGMLIETALIGSFRLSSGGPKAHVKSLPDHFAVYRAIAHREPGDAREAMRNLLSRTMLQLRQQLGTRRVTERVRSMPDEELHVFVNSVLALIDQAEAVIARARSRP